MRHYRCKCGNRTAFGSMPPSRCASCPDCGSDLAEAPDLHREPLQHEFSSVEQVDTDAGPRPLTRCCYCHRTRGVLLKTDINFRLSQVGTHESCPVCGHWMCACDKAAQRAAFEAELPVEGNAE